MDYGTTQVATMTPGLNSDAEGLRLHSMSAVIVSSDGARRRLLTGALTGHGVRISREFSDYPDLDELLKASSLDCQIIVVDLVPDLEVAIGLLENISADQAVTVMAYASGTDPELLMRCMRAGAREFLMPPLSTESFAEALVRASVRLETSQLKKATGKMLLFTSAKGGSGVTTLASNFALALRQESGKDIALVDLNLHLGDVSVLLGMTPRYTVLDALHSGNRMDTDLVSTMLVEHASGLKILAGPDEYHPSVASENGNLRKLLRILRGLFPFVVVDGGSGLATEADSLLQMADVVYMVTQVDIPSLRNAQRVLSHMQKHGNGQRSVEIVLNRFDSRGGIAQEQVEKALTAPVKWRIPNDYAVARSSHNAGSPLMMQKSALSVALRQMAQAACGKSPDGKRRKFGLFS